MNRALACVIGATVSCAAHAAGFADPTRPPDFVASEAVQPTPAGPRLESVLIAPGRRVAVISGQRVALGEKFRDGRVVRITETEVAIRSGANTEVLKLFPEIDKRSRAARGERKP